MASRWTRPLRSLRVRITLAAVAVTTVAVTAAGWLLVRSVEDAQVADTRAAVGNYVDLVALRLQAGIDPPEAIAAGRAPGTVLVSVVDEQGEVVASNTQPVGPGAGHGPAVAGPGEVGDGAQIATSNVVRTADATFTITATAPIDQVERNVAALTARLTIGLPALVALVGVIAWVLVGRALRPVEAMRAEAERITGSTIHHRLPEPATADEVGRLARTMNTMLDRLEASAAQRRRFVSDASHELRSPVATLRAGLEASRNKPGPDGWAARVDGLLAEEERLETLLDDLLLLASYDEHGPGTSTASSVDLVVLAVEEAQRPRRGPVRTVTPPDCRPVTVSGSRRQLARALSNLIDNAARHATAQVEVTVHRDVATARIIVDDDGPGIAPDDRERVFERFTRLDDGRARHHGGTGLGLAVVRSIVTGHHGRVHIDTSPLGGARLVAELPAEGPQPAGR